jgi:hypothetical protein
MSDPGTDKQAAELLERRGHLAFNWEDLDAIELPNGIVTRTFRMTADEDAPTIFNVYYPPGCKVDAHTHDCDYTEIILEGSQKVGATWHYAGDVRIGLANRGYGPLVAGDDGARVLFMFKDGRWPAIALGKTDQESLGSHVIQAHLDAKESRD